MNWQSALLLAGAALLCGCSGPPGTEFLNACEEVLKERLGAPSTYALIGWRLSSEPVDPDDYLSRIGSDRIEYPASYERDLREITEGIVVPTRHIIDINYDAANAFGVSIRDWAVCDLVSGSAEPPTGGSVRIDGITHLDWLLGASIP